MTSTTTTHKLIAVKVMGVTTDTSICQCCGKIGLKKTVAILFEDGQVLNYGTTCAANAFPKMKKSINSAVEAAQKLDNAQAYISKWFASGATMRNIADCVAVKYCACFYDTRKDAFILRAGDFTVAVSPIG